MGGAGYQGGGVRVCSMVKFISSGIAALSYLKGHYNADRPGRVSDWNDTANVDGNGRGRGKGNGNGNGNSNSGRADTHTHT